MSCPWLPASSTSRCRVQRVIAGRRGRAGDRLYRARRTLLTGADLLTDTQARRLEALRRCGLLDVPATYLPDGTPRTPQAIAQPFLLKVGVDLLVLMGSRYQSVTCLVKVGATSGQKIIEDNQHRLLILILAKDR